ncbi:MAG TPA: peptidase MA family metallohydrolase [Anaerolineales bacterium]|nr:peptidase MA family metallohydrolase [Anaerolineales bacterium]
MRFRYPLLIIFMMGFLLAPTRVTAAPQADVSADSATLEFPNTVTFSATLEADAPIVDVTLEYGNDQLTCGEVTAKAFPDFTPGTSTDVSWTWDMRQSGSLPPGANIWWRWRYVDESGSEYLSETQSVTWLDNVHDWQTLSESDIRLHYYGMSAEAANTMLASGIEGLRRNREQAGMTPDVPVDIFVYPNYEDMRDAILYEPQWTGGLAYSDFSIIIMGISGDANWDQDTIIHELTHILVGRNAFTCVGFIPTWLNEGLAVYSEGELDGSMKTQLDLAIRDDTLFPLRTLGGSFSEIPEKALLSYAQSYGVVKFMLETYGQEKMDQLLRDLSDAKPIDAALIERYGLDTDGLDTAWRESVGLAPLVVAQATAMPTPTHVPTFVPISGVPLAVTPTPYAIPTSSFSETESPEVRSGPPILLTVALLCFCLMLLLIVGVIVLGVVLRRGNTKGGDHV